MQSVLIQIQCVGMQCNLQVVLNKKIGSLCKEAPSLKKYCVDVRQAIKIGKPTNGN